jgi:hypothetical protein
MEKEKIYLTEEELNDFGFTRTFGEWLLRGEKYTYEDEIRTDQYSDGESWDTVVKRESDGKFFKWGCWDAGSEFVMEHGDNCMVEVFPKTITTVIYE